MLWSARLFGGVWPDSGYRQKAGMRGGSSLGKRGEGSWCLASPEFRNAHGKNRSLAASGDFGYLEITANHGSKMLHSVATWGLVAAVRRVVDLDRHNASNVGGLKTGFLPDSLAGDHLIYASRLVPLDTPTASPLSKTCWSCSCPRTGVTDEPSAGVAGTDFFSDFADDFFD